MNISKTPGNLISLVLGLLIVSIGLLTLMTMASGVL